VCSLRGNSKVSHYPEHEIPFCGGSILRDFPFEGALIGTPCASWLWYSVLKLVSLKIVWNYAQFSVVRMEVPSAVLELQV
jgi:hypothetical protein